MHPVFPKISTDPHLSAFRRLPVGACCLYLAVVGFGSLGYGFQEETLALEANPPARQNTILRAYFRKQFANMRSFHNTPGWRNDPFAENFVDRQIDHFLSQLHEKLSLLRSHFSQVEASRTALLTVTSPQEQRSARLQWETSLRKVERYSGDVWNLLRYILTNLEDRDHFKPRFSAADMESVFRRQVEFMGEEIVEAERKIQHYFFESGRTVQVEDLRGENMLIHLYHVKQMAKKLKGEKC